MARLEIALLGPFRLVPDLQVLAHFESHKVRSLLAFLVIEHNRPHARDTLAELLWPDEALEAARGNFRRGLANLRSAIGDRKASPPLLRITRDTVQFNAQGNIAVAALRFLALAKTPKTGAGRHGDDGLWTATGASDWATLPQPIEVLIAERIDRLSAADRALLQVACVQGQEFTADIVAAVLAAGEDSVVERLSGELTTVHRIVCASGVQYGRGRPVCIYHFRHALFRTFLYSTLDEVQRFKLERAVEKELQHKGCGSEDLSQAGWL